MTNNLSKSKLEHPYTSTCAVCLGTFHLQGERNHPIRHGFSAHNVKHGQTGGWHTGQCSGVSFPHLGESTEGTVWALGQIKDQLARTQNELARLATKPALEWSYQPTKRVWGGGKVASGEPVLRTLTVGCEQERIEVQTDGYTMTTWVPSYEAELKSRMSSCELHIRSLESDKARYEQVITTWKPFAKTRVVKVEMVHKQINRELSDGRKFSFASCNRRIKLGGAAKMTTDDSKVTCKRCGA